MQYQATDESVEGLTAEEWKNLANYFITVERAIQREEQDNGVPLLDEYCWMHADQPHGGGWSCAVCHAKQQQQAVCEGAG